MPAYNAFAYQNPYLANGYYYPQAQMFQPYNYSMQGQNQMPQSAQQNQTQAQFSNIWFNGGENEARMYPVAPNNAVALWSETEPIIYLKKADASGKPEFKVYDLVERKQEAGEVSYASKDDMSSLIGIVKDVYCIWDYETKMQMDGYSEYPDNYAYDNSYARGNVKRNSMGQYSRDGMMNNYPSRRMNYSRADAKEEFINQLRDLMGDAPDDRTREHVQRMIHDMEQ